jgi:predicted AlkP superfamily pyrophosphatase or phosphodiesterase
MIGNTWWDRDRGEVVACADDPTVIDLSYGAQVDAPGESAGALLVPTLADELRAQGAPAARVVSLSLKARSALTMAGQRPDAVAWVVDQGAWVTSTYVPNGLSPDIAEYVSAHPVERQLYTVWDRTLPAADYLYEDRAVGVRADAWQKTFPHTVQTWDDWEASPLSDEYLTEMALHAASRMKLGEDGRTDMLAIGFSALDLVGHIYGPDSHEVQDVLVRLDRTLGTLFDGLDSLVGAGNYVVALSADHGVAPVPERVRTFALESGRVPAGAVQAAAQAALSAVLGRGRWVNRLIGSDLYLEEGVLEALDAKSGALDRLQLAIQRVPGVLAVFTCDQIMRAGPSSDPLLQKVASGFLPSRSGDLVVLFKPYWLVGGNGGSTHGSPHRYDTHVPLVLMGKGITPGKFLRPVTPLDIAPTLAYLAGITLSQAQGHILQEAVTLRPPPIASPK